MNTAVHRAQELNAFISIAAPAAIGEGPRVAVKDLVDVAGCVTTGGGRVFPLVPAARDAPLIARLRDAGCCFVGKTNLDEFAYGALGANEHFGDMHHPHARDRIAGGSSGGSAIAVAVGAADWAIGTDTGGSIRIPAGLCGVVGFKPTLGTIDRTGVVLLSETLDTVGALAPDVRTAVRAVEQMSGRDLGLPTEAPALTGMRIAVARAWIDALDDTTAAAWERVAAGIDEIALPPRDDMAAPALTILDFEAAARHGASLQTDRERYGWAMAAKLDRSREVGKAEYQAALAARAQARERMAAAMAGVDAVLLPVTPDVAPLRAAIGPRARLLQYVRPFNTTGQPVIALPAPTDGLPVGIQVVAAPGADRTCAAVALALEAAWARLR
jgi:Asp-tRNA(Asn)/Glu-tRNA(Gln) amidotransferase A subunit family amidase